MRVKQHRLIRPFAIVRSARATPGRAIRGRTWLLVALLAAAFAALTASAYADAPNPTSIKVDSQTVSGSSVKVTVSGTWTWEKSATTAGRVDCNDSRIGVGVAVGWGDNTAHPLKPKNSKTLIYVGDAQDNWVHSVTEGTKTVDGPFKPSPKTILEEMTGETPEMFGEQGISPPKAVHAAVPTKTDAEKWVSNCGPTAQNTKPSEPTKGYPNGSWGPISHTYTTPGPHTICPVMYDPHGNRVGGHAGSPKEIIAGGTGHNGDNSVESNNNPNPCVVTTVVRGAPDCGAGPTGVAYSAIPFEVLERCPPRYAAGFDATRTSELGDAVKLAGSGTNIQSLTVVFSSYACSDSGSWDEGNCVTTGEPTYKHKLFAHIYEVQGPEGEEEIVKQIGEEEIDQAIPFRPSAEGASGHACGAKFWEPAAEKCKNGKLFKVTFPFASTVTVPSDRRVIWTVSFNTTFAGKPAIGEPCELTGFPGCPYDALNVATWSYAGEFGVPIINGEGPAVSPYSGKDTNPNAWWNAGPPKNELAAHPEADGQSGEGVGGEPHVGELRPVGEILTN